MRGFVLVATLCIAFATATVYFQETFDDDWESRWVQSTHKGGEAGKIDVTAGPWYGDAEADKGLTLTEDARFYQVSASFDEFSNKDKDLVMQYQVRHPQKIDCGGGYLKIGAAGLNQEDFNGDDEYNIMFGPDICGSTRKTHVIFANGGENHLIKKQVRAEFDQLSHVYTLIVHPDNKFEVLLDGEEVTTGAINSNDDFDIVPPQQIEDPDAEKPSDWVDDEFIDDPEDVKPEDWDDEPEEIADPEAEKPEDWDDDLDGDWEPPMIANPEYKGEWTPKQLKNPDYVGPWKRPLIDNPEYKGEEAYNEVYAYPSFGYVGIEVWQVKSGSIFDNIIITDSVEEAAAFRDETWGANHEAEKEMFDKIEEEKRAQEEEERKAAAEKLAEEEEEEDEYEEEDEHDEL